MTRRQAIRDLAVFLAASPLLRGQLDPRPGHARVPSLDELANVFDFERVARDRMTRRNYDYVAGGVEDEFTLRRNRRAFDWATLVPRALHGVKAVDLSTEILGRPMASPILVAPTGGQSGVHPQGDVEMHRGASAAKVTMCVSHVAVFPLEKIAEAAEGPLWSQLYVHMDLGQARERVDQAVALGAEAIVWTVDAQYRSLRERLAHDANLTTPPSPEQQQSAARRRRRGRSRKPNPYRLYPETPDLGWSFLDTLRGWTRLPIVVKGLLTAEDAELAVENGADAIVVSNHGARYLAYAPSTIEVLPEIVAAVAGRAPVLVDGGFRRGSDILKALAIGAQGVLLGRAALWGLGAFGAAGAQRVLEILQAELKLGLAALGCAKLAELNPSFVETDFP